MIVRVANQVFDETSKVLANGQIEPVARFPTTNQAKLHMRTASFPKRSFDRWKDLGKKANDELIKLCGASRPAPVAGVTQVTTVQLTPGEVEILRAQAADRVEFGALVTEKE